MRHDDRLMMAPAPYRRRRDRQGTTGVAASLSSRIDDGPTEETRPDGGDVMQQGLGRVLPWLGLAARLVVGGVWVVAGAIKIADPAASVRAVRAYRLLRKPPCTPWATGSPSSSFAIGVLLILGVGTRVAGRCRRRCWCCSSWASRRRGLVDSRSTVAASAAVATPRRHPCVPVGDRPRRRAAPRFSAAGGAARHQGQPGRLAARRCQECRVTSKRTDGRRTGRRRCRRRKRHVPGVVGPPSSRLSWSW